MIVYRDLFAAAGGRDRADRSAAGLGAPVERAPIAASELGGLGDLLTPEGDLRSLPFHLADKGGMDGIFAARLKQR